METGCYRDRGRCLSEGDGPGDRRRAAADLDIAVAEIRMVRGLIALYTVGGILLGFS